MGSENQTIVCLSHLRWNFVYQRPQHLLSRCAREHRVVFFEEPMRDAKEAQLELRTEGGVVVAVPHVPPALSVDAVEQTQRRLLDSLLYELDNPRPVLWYYSPMSIAFTHHVKAKAVVYDCMDELSLFHGAPPELRDREEQLLKIADLVFTGGHSLYAYKRDTSQHRNIHSFPSSVDVPHFAQARDVIAEPADQAEIPYPRIGYYGVIDERMDLGLLDQLAEQRPDLQFVMIGPVVKIDPSILPRRSNIHYLGGKTYQQLPAYIAGWDVAMMPFARNDSTRFISPTKTPEYLAAGKPVVSTSITDVVRPYGREGLAWIADEVSEFCAALDEALTCDREALTAHADAFLADQSWDHTWQEMWAHVERAIATRGSLRSTGVQPSSRPGTGAASDVIVPRGREKA